MLGNSVWNLSKFPSYLNWLWDFFIFLSFFYHRPTVFQVSKNTQLEPGASRFHSDIGSTEPVECAVCLSEIEEDDEIRLLRCKHLFHQKCLDRCVEYRHMTCPLCRDCLAGPRVVCELGRELIVLCFGGNGGSSDDDYDNWWLR